MYNINMTKTGEHLYFKDEKEYQKCKKGFIYGRRCKAHKKRTGEPCGKWSSIGRPVCRNHGGLGGMRLPEGKQMNTFGLTAEERKLAYLLLKLWLEDLYKEGQDVKNMDKTMLADTVALYIKSNRNLTDSQKWQTFKYKDLFLKFAKELAMTRKERKRDSALANIAQSFDMVLSHGVNKPETQRNKKKEEVWSDYNGV